MITIITIYFIVLKQNKQKQFAEAENMYISNIDKSASELGEYHMVTLQYISNLALLYYKNDKYKEAKPWFKKCILIGEKLYGPKNSAVLFWKMRYKEVANDECIVH